MVSLLRYSKITAHERRTLEHLTVHEFNTDEPDDVRLWWNRAFNQAPGGKAYGIPLKAIRIKRIAGHYAFI